MRLVNYVTEERGRTHTPRRIEKEKKINAGKFCESEQAPKKAVYFANYAYCCKYGSAARVAVLFRIAFASIPASKIEKLFDNIHSACKDCSG